MSESTLSLGYRDFQKEVGFFLGYGRTYTSYSSAQVSFIDDIIQAALRRFYHPIDPGTREHYEWKFLKLPTSLTTIASYTTGTISSSGTTVTLSGGVFPSWTATNGKLVVGTESHTIASRTDDTHIELSSAPDDAFSDDDYELQHNGNYDLPDNWNGWACKYLTFQPEELDGRVRFVPEETVRSLRQIFDSRQKPCKAAVRAKSGTTSTTGQRFELMLHPIPDDVYILDGLYNVMLNKIDATTYPYPVGGMVHGNTILEACLLIAAERQQTSKIGERKPIYEEALLQSISVDKEKEPSFYGYNGDNSEGGFSIGPLRLSENNFVKYEGVIYTGS